MALTGHRTPGMIGVYARHEYREEKISAVRAIEREILRCVHQTRARTSRRRVQLSDERSSSIRTWAAARMRWSVSCRN